MAVSVTVAELLYWLGTTTSGLSEIVVLVGEIFTLMGANSRRSCRPQIEPLGHSTWCSIQGCDRQSG